MNILGIETSCDETAAAVVENGRWIRSNIIVSSLKEHSRYGGIIPEIASRRQLECINPVVHEALVQAKVTIRQIDAVAVTHQPGLIGSLLVGTSFAKALSFTLKKPLVKVDHIKAHLYANFLRKISEKENRPGKSMFPQIPAIGLVASGGHTSLYHLKDFHSFRCIGQTRDDAVGEAYDKVARLLGLGYPGGPVIDRLSLKCQKTDIHFTCAQLPDTLDFSFSGIKTAVLYHAQKNKSTPNYSVEKVARGFQNSVVSVLIDKCLNACRKYHSRTLLIGGGVAANSQLREGLAKAAQEERIRLFVPDFQLCTDNAAMIAGLGYQLIKQKVK